MRHFIVELQFQKPFSAFGDAVNRHRAFLQGGYDRGLLLMSGPSLDRTGGMLIAREESPEALEHFFQEDPYRLEGLATYRYVEFTPAKSQAFLQAWLA